MEMATTMLNGDARPRMRGRPEDLLGQPLASRIAAQANGGQILVSSLLKELTRSVGDLQFGEVRTVALKGIAQPQELSLVEWQ